MGKFVQDAGVTPLLFSKDILGCPRHYTGALGPTQTTGWAPPADLTNTSSSSNLVFSGVSHPGTDQLNPA